ncbi:AEC family transporter [Aciduricibacillus chroicocephali]|uniref:AEC family transporter n=1 Tax=Aciduricibacillus chroicocephali TaxID=3054939 RepID=A0ABY9KTL7_9BACI|nr:AEC family transporter [Bacillaceae bacterium 44XB]
MGIFFSVMLPIMAVFALGYGLQRWKQVQVKQVSTVSIYIFMPLFFFSSLYEAKFDQRYTIMIVFILFLLFVMVMISKLLGKIFGWTKSVESASILSTAFMNGGNYGIPMILFTFGKEALPFAVFYMVIQSMVINFFGVYFANRDAQGMARAIRKVFEMPATYAAIIAIILNAAQIRLPDPVYDTIKTVGDGSIPLMMVILGMQLATIRTLDFNWKVLISSVSVRMIVSPLIAWGFVELLGIGPIIGGIMIIMSAMPSAASATMYAIEFDTEPDLVTSATLITTVFSFLSITVLLNVLT